MNWTEAAKGLENIGNQFSLTLARVLFDAVKELPDTAAILEIGAFHGFSTCALAYACVGTRRHVWTIDTFIGRVTNTNFQDGENYFATFRANVAARDLTEYITPLVGKSADYYKWNDDPFDLLFIDGNHDIMLEDWQAFFPHLKRGGMLFMHDVEPDGEVWRSIAQQLTGVEWQLRLGWGRKR